jgi:hypothetical protein
MRRLLTGLVASGLTVAGLALPASSARADHHRDWDRHGHDGRHRDHDRDGHWRHRYYGWSGYCAPYSVYAPVPYPCAPYPGYAVTFQTPYIGFRVVR